MHGIATALPHTNIPQSVAVKMLKSSSASKSLSTNFIREALRLHELDHDNVIRLLAVCTRVEPYMLVLEYMSNGDLKSLLRTAHTLNTPLTLTHLMKFLSDVSAGFAYLQQKQFIHRDLATRNVLVSGSFDAKIGDFGMAKRLYRSEYYSAAGANDLEGSLALPLRCAYAILIQSA